MAARRASPMLLAALSGALYALALPPFGLSLIGWIALAPLFVALAGRRPAHAFALGILWFFVASLGFASPMPHLVSTYFHTSWLTGAAAFVGLTVVFGPLYGAYAAWLAWLVGRGRANPLLGAAGFAVIESARTSAGSIFGWALLAHTQTPGALVVQTADVGGAYLPGMILCATSYGAASVVTSALTPRGRAAWMTGVGVVAAAALGYGVLHTHADDPADGLRVAVVQGGIEHAERWRPGREAQDLAHYVELTQDTELQEPDLVVWPEYAVSFNLREASDARADLFEVSEAGGPDLLFGAPYHRGPDVVQNSAFLIHDGALAGRYDKNELLPFAERSPWPERITLGREQYTPGRKAYPLPSGETEVGVFLCSEGLRPGLARQLAANGATAFANLSNDSWLGNESAARLQLRSTALRAVENRRFLIRATGSGMSAILAPDGRVMVESTFGQPDVLFGVIQPRTQRTFYGQWGDLVAVLAALIVVGGTAGAALRPTSSTPVEH